MRTKISAAAQQKAAEEARIKRTLVESPIKGPEFKAAIEKASIIQLKWSYLDAIDIELHRGGNISRAEAISHAITAKLIIHHQEVKRLHNQVLDFMKQAQDLSKANPGEFIVYGYRDNNYIGIGQGKEMLPEAALQFAAYSGGKKIRKGYHV